MSRPSSARPVLAAIFSLPLILPASPLEAQTSPGPAPKPSYSLVGVDVFGNSRTPRAEIAALLDIKEGTEITPELVTRLEEKLRSSHRFAYVKIGSTNYGNGTSYLTVDVIEKGDERRFVLNSAPTASVEIPKEILDWVRRYEKASFEAFQKSPNRLSDIDQGHFLDSDPGVRMYEERMLEMAPAHYDLLVRALREDKDPEKRALCALLLGWAKDKKAVIPPLESALKDPDLQVRTNAGRSLIPIAYLAVNKHIPFPLDPILDLIHYPSSADRTKACALLIHLAGDPANHAAIREKAGGILVQLAEARQPTGHNHALTILGMVTGKDYGRDVKKWKTWWAEQKKG